MTPPYHPPAKYSLRIAGHRTSISLEPVFWELLVAAAARRGEPVNALVARIDAERIRAPATPGLAGAIRVWLVADLLAGRAGDGDGNGHEKGGEVAPAAPNV